MVELCAHDERHPGARAMMLGSLLLTVLATTTTATVPPCVFDGARLFNETGHAATCSDLGGLAVALYFAGEWCPLCRRFTPALRAFRKTWNASVQIVFVSSDMSEVDAAEHYAHQLGGWLALAWDDPLAVALKRRHKVWSGREVGTFGYGRRSGVPAVVVIDRAGAELAFLPGERWGAAALHEWENPADGEHAWPLERGAKSEL